jgi:hypothetical protein
MQPIQPTVSLCLFVSIVSLLFSTTEQQQQKERNNWQEWGNRHGRLSFMCFAFYSVSYKNFSLELACFSLSLSLVRSLLYTALF